MCIRDRLHTLLTFHYKNPFYINIFEEPLVKTKFEIILMGYPTAVSYTHLDVYKRQAVYGPKLEEGGGGKKLTKFR